MSRTNHLTKLDHDHLWHPFTPQSRWTASQPVIIERAEGCTLFDTEGRAYVDGISSLWTNVHGHRHPKLDQAVRDQLDRVAHSTMLGLSHVPAIQLAQRLTSLVPWGLDRVFYSDNGSTATEIALKMAFQCQQQRGETERTRFAALSEAYHGDTLGAVSVGAIPLFHQIYKPLLFDSVVLPAPVEPGGGEEDKALELALLTLEAHSDELAALIVEPLVQGAAGMKMHTARFLRPILERARSLGILVVIDEVATGFGRTGSLFATEQVGFTPDFLCLAKGLAAGYLPLAATLTTEAVYEAFLGAPEEHKQFFHGHTFTGNPLACAVALASLDLFEDEEVLQDAIARSDQLDLLLKNWSQQPGIRSVRHKGLMVGIELQDPITEQPYTPSRQVGHRVAMRAREHGAIVRPLGDVVVLNPPLSIRDDELTQLVRAVSEAVRDEQAG